MEIGCSMAVTSVVGRMLAGTGCCSISKWRPLNLMGV
jgi:hypothetical protein